MKYYLLLVVFCFCISSRSQQIDSDETLFQYATAYKDAIYEDNLVFVAMGTSEAAKLAREKILKLDRLRLEQYDLLITHYPDSKHYPEALLEKGLLHFNFNEIEVATKTLLQLIGLPMEVNWAKREATLTLAELEAKCGNCEKAKEYISKLPKYKVYYHCGNEWQSEQWRLAHINAKCCEP